MNALSWLSHHGFRYVHGHHLIYNTCWEDPRLDRVAMRLTPNDVVMVITSAGCNVLDYLLDEPAHVHAVDLNPRQNALLELKIAAIRRLDYDDFFAMFGRGRLDSLHHHYPALLRPLLTDSARQYWDPHLEFFSGTGPRPSFYFRGTTGYFAWLINFYIDRVARIRDLVNAILGAPCVAEQRRIYDVHLRDELWKPWLRWFMRRDTTLMMLGVPKPQRRQIDRDYFGGIAQFVEDSVRSVFAAISLHDNYFWRVYLTGQYTPECCPNYLKPDSFQRLKSGLVDRVSIHTASVAGFLEENEVEISKYVLLDHQDWLSDGDGAGLKREWQAITQRAAPQARVLWRSAGTRTDYIDRVRVNVGGHDRRVRDLLCYNRDLAGRLHSQDRVHTYGSFHIADLATA